MRHTTVNEYGETVIRVEQKDVGEITTEEMVAVMAAKEKEYVYDEDCPPMSELLKDRMRRRIGENARMNQTA
ncbi:MAG: hypothetical protein IK016_09190 [Lachnospiraceae bacterium]|nr:hypothetical protein [Lachnospiraceae bacterium]